jgi:hypothetical protein
MWQARVEIFLDSERSSLNPGVILQSFGDTQHQKLAVVIEGFRRRDAGVPQLAGGL